MTTSDLKLRIFRQIDALEKAGLEGIYGVIMNYINGQKDISDWDNLSENQRLGLLEAIDELDAKRGIQGSALIDKFRKKYSHE